MSLSLYGARASDYPRNLLRFRFKQSSVQIIDLAGVHRQEGQAGVQFLRRLFLCVGIFLSAAL